mmetsp:Transcript_100843/g.291610  ORF Transcript_100843/g.291610 Transcript_100843/m.291610 type:complete len:278 (+) Transcript_100843:221-1054(+)
MTSGSVPQNSSRHEDLHLLRDLSTADRAVVDGLMLAAERAQGEVLAREADHVSEVVHANDASGVLGSSAVSTLVFGCIQLPLQLHVLDVERILQHHDRIQLHLQVVELQAAHVSVRVGLVLFVQGLVLDALLLERLHPRLHVAHLGLHEPLAPPKMLDVLPEVRILVLALPSGTANDCGTCRHPIWRWRGSDRHNSCRRQDGELRSRRRRARVAPLAARAARRVFVRCLLLHHARHLLSALALVRLHSPHARRGRAALGVGARRSAALLVWLRWPAE